jgi:hypothetical protein
VKIKGLGCKCRVCCGVEFQGVWWGKEGGFGHVERIICDGQE